MKFVLGVMLALFVGNTNLVEGMLSEDGIWPIGIGLHEPFGFCVPLVSTSLTQLLMKLLVEVSDGAVPGSGLASL